MSTKLQNLNGYKLLIMQRINNLRDYWTTDVWRSQHQHAFVRLCMWEMLLAAGHMDWGGTEWLVMKGKTNSYLAPPPPSTSAIALPVRIRARREKSECRSGGFSNTRWYISLWQEKRNVGVCTDMRWWDFEECSHNKSVWGPAAFQKISYFFTKYLESSVSSVKLLWLLNRLDRIQS